MTDDAPEMAVLKTEIPLADATLRDAASADEADEAYFLRCFGPVLLHFPQITPDAYWELTVTELASLMGAVNDKP